MRSIEAKGGGSCIQFRLINVVKGTCKNGTQIIK
jgi:hypothetical protein